MRDRTNGDEKTAYGVVDTVVSGESPQSNSRPPAVLRIASADPTQALLNRVPNNGKVHHVLAIRDFYYMIAIDLEHNLPSPQIVRNHVIRR